MNRLDIQIIISQTVQNFVELRPMKAELYKVLPIKAEASAIAFSFA